MASTRFLAWLALFGSTALVFVSACSSDSSGGGGKYIGPAGCSTKGDCAMCGACFDKCLCESSGDSQLCLAQCTTVGSGGAPSGGGAGGVPSGGAPNGGGAPSGGGAPGGGGGGGLCTQFQTTNAACNDCLHGPCCGAVNTCVSNQACISLVQCIAQACATSPDINSCVQQFCGQYASGAQDYNGITSCAQANCPGACG